jgi:hypothetical protein
MSLDGQMCQILAEMSVLSEAGAAQLGDVTHGGERDNSPRGCNEGLVDEYHRRYNGAWGDRGRREVIEAAVSSLEEAKRMRVPVPDKDPDPTPGSAMWKKWIANHPDTPGKLGTKLGLSRQYISKIREQYDLQTR